MQDDLDVNSDSSSENTDDGTDANGGNDSEGQGIPLERFNEATGKLKDEISDMKAEMEELRANQPAPAPLEEKKSYTRAELNNAVDEGQITQETADQIMDDQITAKAVKAAEDTTKTILSDNQQTTFVQSEMAKYKAAKPDVLVDGSEERKKVIAEFNYLVGLGEDPKSAATELKALRSLYGPVDSLQKKEITDEARQTHQDVGGGEETDGGSLDTKKVVKGLTKDRKEYYRKAIDKGIYKDWDAVAEVEGHRV